MLANERQMSDRASVLPIEEIYTDAEVNLETDYDRSTGFTFDYPMRWLNDTSQYKRIGIRKLSVTPSSHVFTVGLRLYTVLADYRDTGVWGNYVEVERKTYGSYREAQANGWVWDNTKGTIHELEDFENIENIDARTETTIYTVTGEPIMTKTTGAHKARMYKYTGVKENVDGHWIYTITKWKRETSSVVDETYYETNQFTTEITSENGLEEILHKMMTDFNSILNADKYVLVTVSDGNGNDNIVAEKITNGNNGGESNDMLKGVLNYDYNYKNATLTLKFKNAEGTSMSFSLFSNDGDNELHEVLKFLNQEINSSNVSMISYRDSVDNKTEMTFDNVWNRKRLFIHSSFSNTKRGIIGVDGDFFMTPSKFYQPPTNSSNFNIKFTTDGVNIILPRYASFVIELCYLLNYKTAKFN
jgi:hypothetical protein